VLFEKLGLLCNALGSSQGTRQLPSRRVSPGLLLVFNKKSMNFIPAATNDAASPYTVNLKSFHSSSVAETVKVGTIKFRSGEVQLRWSREGRTLSLKFIFLR